MKTLALLLLVATSSVFAGGIESKHYLPYERERNLHNVERSNIQRMRQEAGTASVTPLTLDPSMVDESTISITLPDGTSRTFTGTKTVVDHSVGPARFSTLWFGKSAEGSELALSVIGPNVYGHITGEPGYVYTIKNLGDKTHAVVQRDRKVLRQRHAFHRDVTPASELSPDRPIIAK